MWIFPYKFWMKQIIYGNTWNISSILLMQRQQGNEQKETETERKLEEANRKRQKSCKFKTLRVSEWG